MPLTGQAQKKLLSIFRAELPELIDIISQGLLRQEQTPDSPPENVDAWMRAAHNIKGAAHGIGISSIGDIAHGLETVFDSMRRGRLQPTTELVDLCLQTLEHIRSAMSAVVEDRPLNFDLPSVLLGLDRLLLTETRDDAQAWTSASEPIDAPVVSAPPVDALSNTPNQNERQATASVGTPPTSQGEREETVRVAVSKLDALSAMAEEMQITKIGLDDHMVMIRELRQHIGLLTNRQKKSWQSRRIANDNAPLALNAETSPFDVIFQNHSISGLTMEVRHIDRSLRARIGEMGDLIAALQEDLRKVRMVTVSALVPQLSLIVRTLGHDLGKHIDLVVNGEDTEIDRAVLDLLRSPLTHLLRNAVDHGIEAPPMRKECGKPEKGTLSLNIGRQGNHITVVLADDGCGIDEDVLVDAAIRKALLTEDEARRLNQRQILDLIFRPGFSTNEMITDISGRGFGLDVVRSTLQRMNGSIDVETQPGHGTIFTLRVPLTLTVEHALVVRVAGQNFALPVGAVERVMMVGKDNISDIEGGQVVQMDSQPLPLRSLASALMLEAGHFGDPSVLPVVVMSAGWHTVALSVDEIVGMQEIVIKPLPPPLDNLRGISGGTLTGRGSVILVLSPSDLVAAAIGTANQLFFEKDIAAKKTPRILVVDDSLTSRTLQKNILEYAQYEVETVADGVAGWEALHRSAFDLVVSDVDMPLMNGFELTEKIKQSDRFKSIPVIIVTSMAQDSHRQRGIAVGADAYVVKGQFETKLLLDLVRQLISE